MSVKQSNIQEFSAGSTTFDYRGKTMASIVGPDGHTLCIKHEGLWVVIDDDLPTADTPWAVENMPGTGDFPLGWPSPRLE